MKNNIAIIVVMVFVIAAGVGFAGGMQYQKSKTPSLAEGRGNFGRGQLRGSGDHESGQDGFRGRFSGSGRPVSGEVISKDDESVTVKDQEGGSKIIFISDTTTVRKTDDGGLDDLTEGTQVVIFGSENDDGSFTAENIQINPEFGVDHTSDDTQGNGE